MSLTAANRIGLTLILVCGIYLAVNLFADPRTPFLLGGDQVFFFMRAQRMYYGEHIYQDFFEFTPPGTDLVYASAFELFGPRLWVTNLVVLLLNIGFCWATWRVTKVIMKPMLASLVTALLIVAVCGKLLSGTHHVFSVLAVLLALGIVIESRTAPRLASPRRVSCSQLPHSSPRRVAPSWHSPCRHFCCGNDSSSRIRGRTI